MKFWLVVCSAVFIAMPLWAGAPIAEIQSMLAKPKVLCGHFEQSKQLIGLKKPMVSNGRFCVVVDRGVLWRTLQPFPNTVRLTRDEIVHLQGDRVAMRLDAKQEPAVRMINGVLFALLAGDLGEIEKLFAVDGTIHDNSWRVTLKPHEPFWRRPSRVSRLTAARMSRISRSARRAAIAAASCFRRSRRVTPR